MKNDLIALEKENYDKNNISHSEYINFVHCVNNFTLNLGKLNSLEEKFFSDYSEIKRIYIIYKNFQKITENIVNDMVYTDVKYLTNKTPWVTINMDVLYSTPLPHIKVDTVLGKILPKSKSDDAYKIFTANVIISTLHRCEEILLFNKTLKDENIQFEIKEKISFTKGYVVCLKPEIVLKMKDFLYYRKEITASPKKIDSMFELSNLKLDLFFKNSTFSSKIWLKDKSIFDLQYTNLNVFFEKQFSTIDATDFVNNINYLNAIPLSRNLTTFNAIYHICNKTEGLNNLYITKNKLYENIYKISDKNDIIRIDDDFHKNGLQKLINSAAMLEIIKKQYSFFENFYINYAYDSRLRIYAETWPVNYQLNHIVRASIIIKGSLDIKKILQNFNTNTIIKENYVECSDVLYNKFSQATKDKLNIFIQREMHWADENIEIKKESLLLLLLKLSPTNIKKNEEKILSSIGLFKIFIKSNLIDYWEFWIRKLKIKNSKLHQLIWLQECFLKIKIDDFSETYWADASSNALQLIALRTGAFNEKLLMLTNIIENNTEYDNVYDFVTEEIKKLDHSEILKKINNKISKDEFLNLQSKEDNKYRIMPACYGMGMFKNRRNSEIFFQDKDEIISKLNKEDIARISDYIWINIFNILQKIGFDLENYKKICKSYKEYDAFVWQNDIGLCIAPINISKSRRQLLLAEINKIKVKKKKETNDENKEKLSNQIKKLQARLKTDESLFWKRTMVKIKNRQSEKKIYVRIPTSKFFLDKRLTHQALTPNTIHAYDASVIFLCLKICRDLGINILVIHDCIGCNLIYAPIVKKIFKIANIEILKMSAKKAPFPLKKKIISEENFDELKIKILESTNFFR